MAAYLIDRLRVVISAVAAKIPGGRRGAVSDSLASDLRQALRLDKRADDDAILKRAREVAAAARVREQVFQEVFHSAAVAGRVDVPERAFYRSWYEDDAKEACRVLVRRAAAPE